MKLIRITLFWLIVFVLFELFFGEAVMSVIVNIWIGIFVLLVIGLIIYALLAKKNTNIVEYAKKFRYATTNHR